MKPALALLCAGAILPISACAPADPRPRPPIAAAAADWREIATAGDRQRLREWRTAWIEGLRQARAAGHGAEIARHGALLQPDAATPGPVPPPGDYSCRVIKIGAQSEAGLPYVAYQPFLCRIREEGGLLSFAKLSGSQRPIGFLFEEGERRMVFLGTLQLGDETRALQYGRDAERNMAGLLERIDERRWRLVFPYPRFESVVDVLELVPRQGS